MQERYSQYRPDNQKNPGINDDKIFGESEYKKKKLKMNIANSFFVLSLVVTFAQLFVEFDDKGLSLVLITWALCAWGCCMRKDATPVVKSYQMKIAASEQYEQKILKQIKYKIDKSEAQEPRDRLKLIIKSLMQLKAMTLKYKEQNKILLIDYLTNLQTQVYNRFLKNMEKRIFEDLKSLFSIGTKLNLKDVAIALDITTNELNSLLTSNSKISEIFSIDSQYLSLKSDYSIDLSLSKLISGLDDFYKDWLGEDISEEDIKNEFNPELGNEDIDSLFSDWEKRGKVEGMKVEKIHHPIKEIKDNSNYKEYDQYKQDTLFEQWKDKDRTKEGKIDNKGRTRMNGDKK